MGHPRTSLLGALCGGLLWLGLGAGASAPRAAAEPHPVVCFIYGDSLAATLDPRGVLTPERAEHIAGGYPLSFELELGLFRRVPVWTDPCLARTRLAWRIVPQRFAGTIHLLMRGPRERAASIDCADGEELERELGWQLTLPITPLDPLAPDQRYYVRAQLSCQTLSFEDLVETDRWLREGYPADSASAPRNGRSAAETALAYLWDLAGLRPQTETAESETFRLADLRRVALRRSEPGGPE